MEKAIEKKKTVIFHFVERLASSYEEKIQPKPTRTRAKMTNLRLDWRLLQSEGESNERDATVLPVEDNINPFQSHQRSF